METNSDSLRIKDGGVVSAKLATNLQISGTFAALSLQATYL